MQAWPRKWTHEHTQRVIHLPVLAVSLLILTLLIYGFLVLYGQVSADETSSSVTLTATVGTIQPGPETISQPATPLPLPIPSSTPPREDEAPVPKPVDTSQVSPSVSIVSEDTADAGAVEEKGGENSAKGDVYATQVPTFSGKTTIKNAIIFIEVHSSVIRATTYADADGNWTWTPADPLEPGAHTMIVTAEDPVTPGISAQVTEGFVIKLPAGQQPAPASRYTALPESSKDGSLFDVLVRINRDFKSAAPGGEIFATIQLINFGAVGNPIDVPITYIIQNSKGDTVATSSETVAVATQISIAKTFVLSSSLQADTYTLFVHVPSKGVVASASDTFKVAALPVTPIPQTTKIDYTIVFETIMGLFFLFGIVTYLEYRRVLTLSAHIRKFETGNLKTI